MIQKTLGQIVNIVVPGDWLLWDKLGDWYRENPYHRYNLGDVLILRNRGFVGFGIRPVMKIQNYTLEERGGRLESKYTVLMQSDMEGDFDRWIQRNEVLQGVERVVEEEVHFKWNVEYLFKRVSTKTLDEAVKRYNSKEITL